MRFVVYSIALDGVNDQVMNLPSPSLSLTFFADTTTTTLKVRPSDGSDFAPINNGGSLTLENASGKLIDPCRVALRASVAVTAYIVQALP